MRHLQKQSKKISSRHRYKKNARQGVILKSIIISAYKLKAHSCFLEQITDSLSTPVQAQVEKVSLNYLWDDLNFTAA